ncbi:MAG: hypothetical protein F6K19_23130 [Cyanothece sp. SIO1E1]|nr:hypothetical protein [Cyanothece sp. SIO1E1]
MTAAISSLLIPSSFGTGRVAQTQTPDIEAVIPDSLSPCLPGNIQRIELLGTAERALETFYLLGVFKNSQYWESLVTTDNVGCLLIKSQADTEVLSAYVPFEISQKLTLQSYQRRIQEAGGLQAFQRGLSEYMSQRDPGEISYFAPEDIWALEQLGVELPEGSYQILEPGKQPDFKDDLP